MAEIPTIINTVLILAGAIGVPSLGLGLAIAFKKLSAFRDFVDSVDDAAQDKSVSEEEFQRIIKNGKVLLGIESESA